MTTFSENIKHELCNIPYSKKMLQKILDSYLINRLKINLFQSKSEWIIDSNFSFIIHFIAKIFRNIYKIKFTLEYSELNKFNNMRTFRIVIQEKELNKNFNKSNVFNYAYSKNNISLYEKKSFLVGAFLSGGSISNISKKASYHLEFRSSNINYLKFLQEILFSYKIFPSLIKRKYNSILYLKKGTEISDFLKIIDAKDSLYYLEDKIISRDLSNQVHRLNNLDMSNISKSTKAGNEQIKIIKEICNTKIYKKQHKKFKHFCTLRTSNPSASLNDLVKLFKQKYSINISRSGISHYVNKAKKIYKSLK